MLNAAAIIIYLGIAFLVYKKILKKQTTLSLRKKAYMGTLLQGALPCTICIIVLELTFDRFFTSSGSVGDEIFTAFFRAALLEEAMKYVFARSAVKKHAPTSKIEYMLLCGMIGAGYGIVEKVFYGGGIILIVNAFLPLHIFFQFLMGAKLYEAKKANEAGDPGAKKLGIMAYVLPFLVHGTWDSLLSVAGSVLESEKSLIAGIGLVLFIALIVAAFIIEIKVIRKMANMPAEESVNTEVQE